MTCFRRSRVGLRANGWPTWPPAAPGSCPWFARNVAFKALILAHLRPVAVRLGHDPDQAWPY